MQWEIRTTLSRQWLIAEVVRERWRRRRRVGAHELQPLHSRGHTWVAFVCSGKRGRTSVTALKSSECQQFITHVWMDSLQPELRGERFREHIPTTSPWLIFPKSSMRAATSHCHHIRVCPSVTGKSKVRTNTKSDYKQLLYHWQLQHF